MTSSKRSSGRPVRIGWDISTKTDPDAFDAYRAGLSDLYATSGFVGGKDAFFNRNAAWQFGGTVFGRGHSTGQTFTRSAAEIRRSGFDGIGMYLDLGGGKADADGRNTPTAPGTVVFRDLTRPSSSQYDRIDLVVTIIPREIAPEWLLDPRMHGHGIDSASPAGRMLGAHLLSTAEVADELDHPGGLAAIDAALVLAQQSVGPMAVMTPEQARAAHRTVRQMAIEVIERDLMNPDLTADRIAVALGVSRSTLYRAFDAAGGVMVSIQRRRLARAYALLRQRRGRSPTVAEIAHDCGFSSESHFSRAFGDRYDLSPGELGSESIEGAPGPGPLDERVRHDLFMDWLRSQ